MQEYEKDNKKHYIHSVNDISATLGDFYFGEYNELFEKVGFDPAFLFRFMYLSTYVDVKDTKLVYPGTGYKTIPPSKLKELMGFSPRLVAEFKKKLLDLELMVIDNNIMYLNRRYIIRGRLCKTEGLEYMRMFDRGIQELYHVTKPHQHKAAGYLFLLIPYVNKYYNVLCKNPKEKEKSKIEPLTMIDICRAVHYSDNKHQTKLRNELIELKVKDNFVFKGVLDGDLKKHIFYINPRIYYSGSEHQLDGLCTIFDIKLIMAKEYYK